VSYETCKKHAGEPSTNGCDSCIVEEYERRLADLGKFLSQYFGYGTRTQVICFLERLQNQGFQLIDNEADERHSNVMSPRGPS
jgi:hypothetical protein